MFIANEERARDRARTHDTDPLEGQREGVKFPSILGQDDLFGGSIPEDGLVDITRYDPPEGVPSVLWTCSQCGLWMELSLVVLLCYRTPVAEFYRDHGVNVDAIPGRELPPHLGDVAITVADRDPLSILVAMTIDDETLTVSVDDEFRITTERTPAGYGPPAS